MVEEDASQEGGVAAACAVADRSRAVSLLVESRSPVVQAEAKSTAGGRAVRLGRRMKGCSPSRVAFGFGMGTSLACSWRQKLGVGSLGSWRRSGRRSGTGVWLVGWRWGCT